MGQFGDTAVKAAKTIQKNNTLQPELVWDAEINLTKLAQNSKDKVCPKEAFVGLSEAGSIKGNPQKIQPLGIRSNRLCAYKAHQYLKSKNVPVNNRPGYITQKVLWEIVLQQLNLSITKNHNSQMDVVIRLWEHGLLT